MTLHCYTKYLFILTWFMSTSQPNAFNRFSLIIKAFPCSLLKMLAINRITLEIVIEAGRIIFLELVYQLMRSFSYKSLLLS